MLANSIAAKSSLEQISEATDFNQTKHQRFVQTFEGIPVWGGHVIVHTPLKTNSLVKSKRSIKPSISGSIYEGLDKDLAEASLHFARISDASYIENTIKNFKKAKGSNFTINKTKIEEIIYIDAEDKAHHAKVVSFVAKPTKGMIKKPTFVVDAVTQEVYQEWDDIQTISNISAGGNGGNSKVGRISFDGLTGAFPKLTMQRDENNTCYLKNDEVTIKDVRKGDMVSSFSCEKVDKEHGYIYWNGDFNGVNGAYSPDNDALYVGKVIKGMYQDWYGISVLTENKRPMMLNMRVHEDMENAYWDGEQMTFGDGGDMFYPLVSLGIGAHEVSHGFTQQHSGLKYFGQSGGLNESFSDMAAAAAEYYLYGRNGWDVGAEITKADDLALRYMDEPTKDCGRRSPGLRCSISNVSDYHVGLNVHFSSGVFNKAFYLLSTSEGWNTKKAFDVMVQANRFYWSGLSSFSSAACGVVKSANDFGYPLSDVANAFKAVGIDTEDC